MRNLLLLPLSISIFFSCSPKSERKKNTIAILDSAIHKTIKNDTVYHEPTAKEIDSAEKTLGSVLGYRFIISGDFDGDGKKEILTEHFFSKKLNRESNKFYDSLSYDHLVGFTVVKYPFSYVLCNNKKIDTLIISDDVQLLGLSFMKNEGDLDGNGTDEISYVIDYADWSSVNTCHIVTNKHGKWIELYSFAVWDWQFPDLFGVNGKITDSKNQEQLTDQEKKLKQFQGLIKKIEPGKIRIIYKNDAAMEDTLVVKL